MHKTIWTFFFFSFLFNLILRKKNVITHRLFSHFVIRDWEIKWKVRKFFLEFWIKKFLEKINLMTRYDLETNKKSKGVVKKNFFWLNKISFLHYYYYYYESGVGWRRWRNKFTITKYTKNLYSTYNENDFRLINFSSFANENVKIGWENK